MRGVGCVPARKRSHITRRGVLYDRGPSARRRLLMLHIGLARTQQGGQGHSSNFVHRPLSPLEEDLEGPGYLEVDPSELRGIDEEVNTMRDGDHDHAIKTTEESINKTDEEGDIKEQTAEKEVYKEKTAEEERNQKNTIQDEFYKEKTAEKEGNEEKTVEEEVNKDKTVDDEVYKEKTAEKGFFSKKTAKGRDVKDNSDECADKKIDRSAEMENDNETSGADFSSDDYDNDPNFDPRTVFDVKKSKNNFFNKNIPNSKPNSSHAMNGSPLKVGGKKRRKGNWRDEERKKLRSGEEYRSPTTKNMMPARDIRPGCTNCKWHCTDKITEVVRRQLFRKYWELGNLGKQREFITRNCEIIEPSFRYSAKQNPRNLNAAFFLSIDSAKIRVCKMFFMNTLGISDRVVRTSRKKMDKSGFIEGELRGKHNNHPTLQHTTKNAVRDFIKKIPRTESHYLRAQTSREYIDGSRSINQIFSDYCKEEEAKGQKPVSLSSFKRIFYTEFQLSFFVPKKDQCVICESIKNDPENENATKEYYEHLLEKELSRIGKDIDKNEAKAKPSTIVVTFDLQAVLPCPKGLTSVFYYKSKLSCFNFTITNISTQETTCYFWDETEGRRGANEIASCIFLYLQNLNQENVGKELDVILYSDNCSGQNKNRYIEAMFMYAAHKLPNIRTITHNYFVCGHTQNEGDTAHSIIEKAVKRHTKVIPVYTPVVYSDIIRLARKKAPFFKVIIMTHKDFYDLKKLQCDIGNNFNRSKGGEKMYITKIRQTLFKKENPTSFFVKTSYEDENWTEINVRKKLYKRSSGRLNPCEEYDTDEEKRTCWKKKMDSLQLQPAYQTKLPVPTAKKAGIMELIASHQIPKLHASYYESLFQTV